MWDPVPVSDDEKTFGSVTSFPDGLLIKLGEF
jgi:hypothetical protein